MHRFVAPLCLVLVMIAGHARAADWPMWRHDARRGAIAAAELPMELHLAWWKDLGRPEPAWPAEQEKLQFDAGYEPVAVGDRLFVPSMIHDCVTAYATDSGEQLWRFHADGPVRFAAACAKDALYFASDDGYLYCLAQADGAFRWKYRGGPSDRKVLGNGRIISTWPARGAPVVEDGVVYFAAGIWPFMGIFVHAVDADSGKPVWTNSGSGTNYLVQPHGSPAFAGVSPQGYLALTNETLILPGGRGVPAGYRKDNGDFLFCHVGSFGKRAGGYDVATGDEWMCNRGVFCCAYSGEESLRQNIVASSERFLLAQSGSSLTAFGGQPASKLAENRDRRGEVVKKRTFQLEKLWDAKMPSGANQILMVAGNRAYATDGADRIFAVELPAKSGAESKVAWEGTVAGTVWNMIAADDRLFVTTREGGLFCFGEEQRDVELPKLDYISEGAENAPSSGARLISRGAVWKYLDDGSNQKTTWRALDFDDEKWKQGRAELGYGDGDEATTIEKGDDDGKFITSYFRHAFELPEDAEFSAATFQAKIDDGAVFYVNGKEAGRLFMPSGEVQYDTKSDGTKSENDFHTVTIDPQLLRTGRNVIAVEVHQSSKTSSDVSFDLELLAEPAAAPKPENQPVAQSAPASQFETSAGEILELTNQRDGICVVLGRADVDLLKELVNHSRLQVLVLEPIADRVNELRSELQSAGLPGTRVAVMQADIGTAQLPPYLCHLVIANGKERPGDAEIEAMYETLRPYGGVAIFAADVLDKEQLDKSIANTKLVRSESKTHEQYTLLTRAGPLPDAAPWTQHGASVANTMMSRDLRVKAPLGLLWFGGPSHEGVLPRHGHGPTPQVVGGRLFIEGRDFIRAVDVYTGRLLWQRELPGVGLYYDNTGHHPGANAIGGNYVSLEDGIYVAFGRECLRLDPATGETLSTFQLPKIKDEDETPYFGYIGVYENVLIAGSSPMVPWTKSNGVDTGELQSRFAEGSAHLVALDRDNGKVLWQRTAKYNFRHNAICAGGGNIFCIDRITDARLALLKRRGIEPTGEPTLYALDAKTGNVAWETSDNVFGTWLTFSEEYNILVKATASFRDRSRDEPDHGIAAYDAKSGKRLWYNDAGYGGPVLLTGDTIITQGTAFDLKTGEHASRIDPLTGEATRWTFTRNYGCNTAIGCPNLLTFRSAAAGFFDLAADGGTGNLGGFRSSCTSNLVPADGVLNAPDYTRTCSCSYQLQCSLALVHMPEAEVWTFQPDAWNGARVHRIGINFGAPGDRRAEDGSLWIDYPSVGGRSPDVPIQVEGESVTYFRQHASSLGEHPLAWVAASGMTGATKVTVKLAIDDEAPQMYTVRLVWGNSPVMPEAKFDIVLQGKTVAAKVAVGSGGEKGVPVLVQTFQDVPIAKELEILLTPENADGTTVLCGIEIVRQ